MSLKASGEFAVDTEVLYLLLLLKVHSKMVIEAVLARREGGEDMAKRKKHTARKSHNHGMHHKHPAYGYIAVGFVFLVLALLLSGLK